MSDNESVIFYPSTGFTPTLDKTDIMRFTDNLQHKAKRLFNLKLRFFICGEYGSEGNRPHYHMLAFWYGEGKQRFNVNKLIENVWYRGFCSHYHNVEYSAITYTLKYQLKEGKYPFGSEPPFSLKSKGLGKSYFDEKQFENLFSSFKHNLSLSSTFENGKTIPLPKYYREIFKAHLDPLNLLKFNVQTILQQRSTIQAKLFKSICAYARITKRKILNDVDYVSLKVGDYNEVHVDKQLYYDFCFLIDTIDNLEKLNKSIKNKRTIKETDNETC